MFALPNFKVNNIYMKGNNNYFPRGEKRKMNVKLETSVKVYAGFTQHFTLYLQILPSFSEDNTITFVLFSFI